jgi:hypothetical protein
MKKIFSPVLRIMTFVVILLTFSAAKKAPCPYAVRNTLNCTITMDITVWDTPPAGCTNVCNVATGVAVGPGSTFSINCQCNTICNIVVKVTHYNGVPIAPVSADFTSGPVALPGGPPCNANNISYNSVTGIFTIS